MPRQTSRTAAERIIEQYNEAGEHHANSDLKNPYSSTISNWESIAERDNNINVEAKAVIYPSKISVTVFDLGGEHVLVTYNGVQENQAELYDAEDIDLTPDELIVEWLDHDVSWYIHSDGQDPDDVRDRIDRIGCEDAVDDMLDL